jgi:hypothetical protein
MRRRARVGAALLALLVTAGFHVWVVPQAMAEGIPLTLSAAAELVWWALAGLTLLLAVRAAVGLLPRRRRRA